MKAYEIADTSDDERYYPLGIFLTFEDAMEALNKCNDPKRLVSMGILEDYFRVEIFEREIGLNTTSRNTVYVQEWKEVWDEKEDEWKWEVIQ